MARKLLEWARELQEASGAIATPSGARTLGQLGCALAELGDARGAIEALVGIINAYDYYHC